ADADADDVGAHSAARAGGEARPAVPLVGERLRANDCVLRAHAESRAGTRDADTVRGAGHAGTHGAAVHHDPQGVLPDAGHGSDPGNIRGATIDFVRRDVAEAAANRERDPERSSGREPVLLYWAGRDQSNPE